MKGKDKGIVLKKSVELTEECWKALSKEAVDAGLERKPFIEKLLTDIAVKSKYYTKPK